MPKQTYDLNDNGKIDPDEREIMLEDRRRIMMDADAKRDGLALTDWDRAAILLEYLRNLPEPLVPRVELLPEVVVLVISMLAVLTIAKKAQ